MDTEHRVGTADFVERTAAMKALELPDEWDHEHFDRAAALDAVIGQESVGQELFDHHVIGLRDAVLTSLKEVREFDIIRLHWPSSLYIPADADWRQFWIVEPPAANRYVREWSSGPPNGASVADGSLSVFKMIQPNERYVKEEAGVGVRYSSTFSLGTVRLRPDVRCKGVLRALLEMYPTQLAGGVRVSATLVLAQWHEIPTGYDLIRWASFPVADSGWRDQSFGPLYEHFDRTFNTGSISEQFLVQGGRTYLFGVVARISLWSTLTDTRGGPVAALGEREYKVWGQHNAVVGQISVNTEHVHIP